MTPFEILGVSEEADDDAIKQAYLSRIRRYTPEHAPTQFQRIRDAYEAIQTHHKRLEYQLFNRRTMDKTDLRGHLLNQTAAPRRPDLKMFQQALKVALKR